jgi:putative membrane protein
MNVSALAATQSVADHWDGPGAWWPIFPLLWFALFFGFFFVMIRFGRHGRRRWFAESQRLVGAQAGKAALAERFANGDIDEQEYRARLAVLDSTSTPLSDR